MQGVLNVLAVLMLSAVLSQKTKRPLATAIPTAFCILMILLQVLGYLHCLSRIDGISLLIIGGSATYFLIQPRETRKAIYGYVFHPSSVVFALLVLWACFLNRNACASAWDDLNYWAASVRALFERNGLEGKYYTVSSGWGDYPLGMQLIAWWFVHSFCDGWSEKWVYIGYYVLLYAFIAPYFSEISWKWHSVLSAVVVGMLLPLVHLDGDVISRLNADLLIATAYGCCIFSILRLFEKKQRDISWVDVVTISVQLAGVVMIKSIGILWACSGAILYYLLRHMQNRGPESTADFPDRKMERFLLAPALLMYFSWILACKLLARETYLVNNLRSVETMPVRWYLVQIKNFFYAVFLKPATVIPVGEYSFGLSLGTLIFAPCLFFLYFWKHREERKKIFTLFLFVLAVCGTYLLVLLAAYGTMFVYEPQAINSVGRYLLPCIFLVKTVIWEIYENCPKKKPDKWYVPLLLAVVVLVSCNTGKLSQQIRESDLNLRRYLQVQNGYRERFSAFHEQLGNMNDRLNASVLYCAQDLSEYDRIHLCYLAEGTAVNLYTDLKPDSVAEQLANSHATHMVICENGVNTQTDYQQLMVPGETFTFGELYRIVTDEGKPALSGKKDTV